MGLLQAQATTSIGVIRAGMGLPPSNWSTKRQLISAIIIGKNIAADYFS